MAFPLPIYRSLLTNAIALLILNIGTQAQTFDKTYVNPTVDDGAQVVVLAPDGNVLLAGYRGDSAMVMKVNPFGGHIWTRTFKPVSSFSNTVYHIAITPDGHITGNGNALGGSPLIPQASFFFKMDLTGSLLWVSASSIASDLWTSRTLPIDTVNYLNLGQVYQNSGTFNDIITSTISATSGVLTGQSPRLDLVPFDPYIDDIYSAIVTSTGSVFGCGRAYVAGGTPGTMRPFISKFTTTGTHLWSKFFLANGSANLRSYGIDILESDDSLTVCCFGDPSGSSSNFSIQVIRMDTLGNVAWAKDYDILGYSSEISIGITKTVLGYAIGGYAINGTANDGFIISISDEGSLIWSRAYGQNNGLNENTRVTCTKNIMTLGNDILLVLRTGTTNAYDTRLIRLDPYGTGSCTNSAPLSVAVTPLSNSSYGIQPNPITYPISISPGSPAGSASITNDGCPAIDVDLGNDTTICSPLLLNASVFGATYQWQDGSTSSTLLASTQGTYWVIATVACCSYTDTIIVSTGAPPIASFSYTPGDSTLTYEFYNTGTTGESATWLFGSSIQQGDTAIHTFSEMGHYQVCLIVTNDCGSDTVCQQVDIFPTNIIDHYSASSYTVVNSMAQGGAFLISVHMSNGEAIDLRLIDQLGRTVQGYRIPGNPGLHQLQTGDLPSGQYLLVGRHGDGPIRAYKVFIPGF